MPSQGLVIKGGYVLPEEIQMSQFLQFPAWENTIWGTRSVGNYDMPPPVAQQPRPRRGMDQSFRRVPYRLRR